MPYLNRNIRLFCDKWDKSRSGFTLIELSVSLAAALILIASLYLFYDRGKALYLSKKQREDFEKIGQVINAKAIQIATRSESICANGWADANCNNTNLYPLVQNNYQLVWNFNNGFSDIFSDLPMSIPCRLVRNSPNQMIFDCSNLDITRIVYLDSNNNQIQSIHNAGQDFNYLNNYSISIEFNERTAKNGIVQHTIALNNAYSLSLTESYSILGAKTISKMNYIADLLKQYATTKRIRELNARPDQNTGQGGMYEVDDFFVPWVWQVITPNSANLYKVCGDTNCNNMCDLDANGNPTLNCVSKSNVWDTSAIYSNPTSSSLTVWNRIRNNLNLQLNLGVDGFGNRLFVALISNGCGSLSSCRGMPPTIPQSNYDTAYNIKPPFVTLVTTQFCYNAPNIKYNCRFAFTYPQ